MSKYSRRDFLAAIGGFAIAGAAQRPAHAREPGLSACGEFHMLVVGDSLIAGQGLRKEDKFSSLTRDWLETTVFAAKRKVALKDHSHSGASIYLSHEERKALEEAPTPLDNNYGPEANISFPSISKQVQIARAEYLRDGISPSDVELVMVSGGITNMGVEGVINPFRDSDKLRNDIETYCHEYMGRLLGETASLFPKALIAVIGYYPMISPKSSTGMVYNAILELYRFPGPVKPVMNNILTKQFFKILHAGMTKRSRIWAKGSAEKLSQAVRELNTRLGEDRALFIGSPIDESTCFGTRDSLLWKMAKKGRSEDDLYDERRLICTEVNHDLKDVDLVFRERFCQLSGIGHPNVEGAAAYAEAIKRSLANRFPTPARSC